MEYDASPQKVDVITSTTNEQEIRDNRAYEWACGRNVAGELSFGVKKNALVPAYAIGLKDVSTKQISCSSNHTTLLTSSG